MDKKPDINESFRLSIQKRIGDFNIDMSEIVFDSIISDETLKEIPIIKTVHAIGKVGLSIRNQFLIKKLYRLLFEIESVTEDERNRFILKLDSEFSKKNIYGNLLILIDRIDNEEKISIMGKILKAMLQDKLNIDIGFRLFSVIDKSYIEDLKLLNSRYGDGEECDSLNEWIYKWNDIVEEGLNSLGLLKPIIGDNSRERKYFSGSSKVEYRIKDYNISSLGKALVEFGF